MPLSAHSGPDQAQIDKAAELARDLLSVVRERHAEARDMLNSYNSGGGGGGQFTPSGANTQQFGAPMRFGAGGGPPPGMGMGMGMDQQQQQNPYSYQVRLSPLAPSQGRPPDVQLSPSLHVLDVQPNQYAGAGLTAPLPPGEAPPAPPASNGDEPAGAQAASGLTPEAYTAWWQSLDQASKDYYTQCVSPLSLFPFGTLRSARRPARSSELDD